MNVFKLLALIAQIWGWTDYDPTQGASSDELTEICNSLYDRCLLAELGVKGFTPANEHKLIKS